MMRSLKVRLTFLFMAAAGVILVAAAITMSWLIERAVWDPLDAALEEEAETIAGLMEVPGLDLSAVVTTVANEKDLGPGKFVRVLARDGAVVSQAGDTPRALAELSPPPDAADRHAGVDAGGQRYRVVWTQNPDGGWCLIGIETAALTSMLRRAQAAIAGTAAGLFATLSLLAWLITRRASTELGRLAGELETIEAGSLDRRLVPRHTLEVDRLAKVLNRLLARLETAMSHLRRFTAEAAHELRTPVAALRAHLEVALGRGGSREAYRDGLIDALEQAERLGRLAEDLLTLSSVEAGTDAPGRRAERVRLDGLASEVAEFLEPVAQEQGRPFTWDAGSPIEIAGSGHLLKRVVLNLLDNAFRHTPTSAAVHLVVSRVDGGARVEVRDAGPGIDPEEVPLLFERFHRGRAAGPGTGLGLALCREIVAAHHGSITVSGAPGGGTRAVVTLPVSPAAR